MQLQRRVERNEVARKKELAKGFSAKHQEKTCFSLAVEIWFVFSL